MKYRSTIAALLILLAPGAIAQGPKMDQALATLKSEKAGANELFSLSFFFERSGRPFSAIEAVKRATEVDAAVPGYHYRHGQLLAKRKRFKEAAAAYAKAVAIAPKTLSFRAAQARALEATYMLKEACVPWQFLLEESTGHREVLDAASNLSRLQAKLHEHGEAEKTWRLALSKLTETDKRWQAAVQVEKAMLAQERSVDAIAFWTEYAKPEKSWYQRRRIADQIRGIARSAGKDRKGALAAAIVFQKSLHDSAGNVTDKQLAAIGLSQLLMRDGKPAAAAGVLKDLVPAKTSWHQNFNAARELCGAYGLLQKRDAMVAVWRAMLKHGSGWREKNHAAGQLIAILDDPKEALTIRQELVKAYESEADAYVRLAQVLERLERYSEAADTYWKAIERRRAEHKNRGYYDREYGKHVIRLLAKAGRYDDAIRIMKTELNKETSDWRIRGWFESMQSAGGRSEGVRAAKAMKDASPLLTYNAAYYLWRNGCPETARSMYLTVAQNNAATTSQRRNAYRQLVSMARTNEERMELYRESIKLGTDFWDKRRDMSELAGLLAAEGRIADMVQVVRDAKRLRRRNYDAADRVLSQGVYRIFNGNRIGPGLRTAQGVKEAEAAIQALYGELAGRPGQNRYDSSFNTFIQHISRIWNRRGDVMGAVNFVRGLAETRDRSYLRLRAAELLEPVNDDEAFGEYMRYLEQRAAEYTYQFERQNASRRRHQVLSIDRRFMIFVKKPEREKALINKFDTFLGSSAGIRREAYALLAMGYHRNLGKPEEMDKIMKQLKEWKHGMKPFHYVEQWIAGAIKMKNSTSQADTRRRDTLLKELERWKSTWAANPEDYQAAINTYKIFVVLGRGKEGVPFLDAAKKVAAADPLILERWGRERMLVKDYAGAAKAFVKASEVTGRKADHEASMVNAFEMAGRPKAALALALDSLQEGRNHGRGVRTPDQMFDLAQRSNQLPALATLLQKILSDSAKSGAVVRDPVLRLSLRTAWDQNSKELVDATLTALLRSSRTRGAVWRDEWRLNNLASQAEQRRRYNDAIRIREAVLERREAKGNAPDLRRYKELAMLYVRAGKEKVAADLMFTGLTRTAERNLTGSTRPFSAPDEMLRGKRLPPGTDVTLPLLLRRDVRDPWVRAIVEMAALEASSGGDGSSKAAGKRLDVLVDAEFAFLTKNSAKYNGILISESVQSGLKLHDRVLAAYRQAAAEKGAMPKVHLALAWRLYNLAANTDENVEFKAKVELSEITKACDAATAHPKATVEDFFQVASVYRRLHEVKEEKRLPGVTVELVMDAYDRAIAKEPRLRIIQKAMETARALKAHSRALELAKRLVKELPEDTRNRRPLIEELLRAGQLDAAKELLDRDDDRFVTSRILQNRAQICMAVKEKVDSAKLATDYLQRAAKLYVAEVGPNVDAKGKPIPDQGLGWIQRELKLAYVAAYELEKALEQHFAAMKNSISATSDVDQMAEAFAKAGQIEKMAVAFAQKVAAAPKDLQLRLAHAKVLVKADKPKAAAVALRIAKALDPDLDTVKQLIAILQQAEEYEIALDECRQWADNYPSDGEAWRTMAAIYAKLGKKDEELRALTMLVEAAPREATNCREVASLFIERKVYDRAISLLERATELRKEEPYRQIDLAEALYLNQNYERAIELCRDALTKDWEKGLSPELMARMPPWRGTFETRAHSVLVDCYAALERKQEAARERLQLPAGYKRPEFKNAVPQARPRRWWPRRVAWIR